jgi:hypothetical protein
MGLFVWVVKYNHVDCEEEDLPENFNLLYKKLLQEEIGSARIYQLILNTLIYYYSK